MKWTNGKCRELIQEYEGYSTLWDPRHGTCYSKNKKHGAWVAIAKAVGRPEEETWMKMESLLGSFHREKAKTKSSMGTGKGTTQH
ncbi:hypothetical protein PR048_027471 [Dryococelus australis]|uniref:MADF domain-containing protein n=1 Tax=Dryococelus australis TaxID=614101 RepID=A0ABQ9GFJ7_9NEOP|nr:hypothetical protein PR048_027471 [Dryococelus australis]